METREVKNITVFGESFTYEKMVCDSTLRVQHELIKRIKINKEWAQIIEGMFSEDGSVSVFLTLISFIQGIFSNFEYDDLKKYINNVIMRARIKKDDKIVSLNDDFSDNPNLVYCVIFLVVLESARIDFFLKSTGMFTDAGITQIKGMLANGEA